MFFGSSKPDPPPTPSTASEMPMASADLGSGSDSVKKAIMRQILVESNTANARLLIEVCAQSRLLRFTA